MILADTGFFVALLVRTDAHHDAAVEAAERQGKEGLLTTWPVLTETTHLLLRAADADLVRAFIESIHDGAASIFELSEKHLPRIAELMRRYRNLPMDLADASLVLCAEETGDGRILSTDARDFGTYRFKRRKPFRNLLRT